MGIARCTHRVVRERHGREGSHAYQKSWAVPLLWRGSRVLGSCGSSCCFSARASYGQVLRVVDSIWGLHLLLPSYVLCCGWMRLLDVFN